MKPKHPGVEEYEARMDALPLKVLCALCEWSYEGTALQARERAAQHRAAAHPELKVTHRRRPGGHLKSFRQPKLKVEHLEEIYAEREKRAKLHGIVIE